MSSVVAERGVESKVSKLEADVENIKSNMAVLASDVRRLSDRVDAMHDSLLGKIGAINDKLENLAREIWATKVWTLLIAAAILGVMAHGFKWL